MKPPPPSPELDSRSARPRGTKVHDHVYPWLCLVPHAAAHKPGAQAPQGCVANKRIVWVLRYVTIGWDITLLVLVLVYRAVFKYEYGGVHQTLLCIVITRQIRAQCFVATTLPLIELECRLNYTGPHNGGGCGDCPGPRGAFIGALRVFHSEWVLVGAFCRGAQGA